MIGPIGIALIFGVALFLYERREIAATRQPAPCHVCFAADELRMVHWTRHGWVHDDTGKRESVTQLAMEVGRCLRQPPMTHQAIPAPEELLRPLPY